MDRPRAVDVPVRRRFADTPETPAIQQADPRSLLTSAAMPPGNLFITRRPGEPIAR
jgi:hypothetical protein